MYPEITKRDIVVVMKKDKYEAFSKASFTENVAVLSGFIPENEHSFAAILSNTEIPAKLEHVADYFNLMTERANIL